jgi:hypothetical protein
MAYDTSSERAGWERLKALDWHIDSLFPCQQVAAEVAAAQHWSLPQQQEFLASMLAASAAGSLTTRDRRTGEPREQGFPGLWPLVTPQDVNEWLEKLEAPYRWSRPSRSITIDNSKEGRP